MKVWVVFNSEGTLRIRWDFTNDMLTGMEHGRLALKLWLVAEARGTRASDMRIRDAVRPKRPILAAGTLVDSTMLGQGSTRATAKVASPTMFGFAPGESIPVKVPKWLQVQTAWKKFASPDGKG